MEMADPRADARAMLALLATSMGAPEPQRSEAERQLEQLQQKPLAAALLLALCEQILVLPESPAAVDTVDTNVRLLGCIWLKHFAKRSWKQTRHWSDDERAQLRHVLLLAALHEPHAPVAVQLALVVATIARGDFPAQWSFQQLFPPMLKALENNGSNTPLLHRRRCVDVTYRLVKELATRRLMAHRKQFALLSVELLPVVLRHWCEAARAMDSSLAMAEDHLGMLLTNTKLLSALLLNAFRDLAMLQNGELVQATLVQFYEQLERFVVLRATLQHELLDKICFRMASLVVGIQKAYPIEFRAYLSPFLALFWNALQVPTGGNATAELPKRLQIESLQFFANVLSCRLYKSDALSSALTGESSAIVSKVITATGDVNLTDAMVLEAQAAVDAFFAGDNGARLEKLLHLVVMHYMKLTPSDLEEWQADPEVFVNLSESLTAQESVRACAEDLFLTLLQSFPTQVIPVLTQLTAATATWLNELATQSQSQPQRVLDIDAVLLAIGLGCYDLHECFDFEPWFLQNLVPLLMNSTNASIGSIEGVPVIKYRIVWLVSCWLAQLTAGIRAPLYDALLNASAFFQSPQSDAALKLRIVQTLESMVTDWGFERPVFVPFLPRALECLYAFFLQTQESESKMKVLGCLEAILQACGADAVSISEQISSPLPAMWNSGGEAENLVRGKILQLLAKLLSCVKECEPEVVQANAAQIQTVHAMCLQVVRFATDVSNPDEVFLMESGLELWTETVEISPAYTEELHLLFAHALRLMERDYEHIKLVLTLLELYVKLGKTQFWQTYHGGVATLVENLLGNIKPEASIQIARVVELLVANFPADQLVGLAPVLKRMMEACLAYSQRSANDTNAAVVEPEGVVVAYLSILARLLMQHLEFTVVSVLSSDVAALVALLDLMLDKFFAVVAASMAVRRRKVWTIAFCSVLDITEEPILERLGQILESCVDVMEEEQELRDATTSGADDEDDEETELRATAGAYRAYASYRKRKQEKEQSSGTGAGSSDADAAVVALDLKALARSKLAAIEAKLGAELFAQLVQSVPSEVVAKLQ